MKNKMITVVFIILFILATATIIRFKVQHTHLEKSYQEYEKACYNESKTYSNEFCELVFENKPEILDTLTFYNQSISSPIFDIFVYFSPLLIMIASVWALSTEFVSGYIKNYLVRKDYGHYIKRLFKNAYKSIWIIPCIILFILVLSFVFSGHFDYSYTLTHSYSTFEEQYLKNPILFMICYILDKVFISIFFANLALIFMKKSKNKIVVVLETYLCFLGIEIVNEAIINGLFFSKTLGIDMGNILNIIDSYSYNNVFNQFVVLIRNVLYATCSFLIVLKVYANKEKVIQASELLKGDD